MDALSYYHARSFEGYRQTLGLRTETATTEQLRATMIRYRALFEDLTGLRTVQPEHDGVADIRERGAGTHGTVAGRPGQTADRTATDPELAAGNRDFAVRNGDLAAQDTNRPADTPR